MRGEELDDFFTEKRYKTKKPVENEDPWQHVRLKKAEGESGEMGLVDKKKATSGVLNHEEQRTVL